MDGKHLHPSWRLELEGARGREALPPGPERQRAYWLAATGAWCANVILVTLHHFGLVERASTGGRWAFRLTESGRLAFADSEVVVDSHATALSSARCLIVQPNFDVLLYTDAATSGSVIASLSRLAESTPGGGVVRTYRLTRASVCRALDAGITLDDALSMLAAESRSPVPANVIQSMTDWARKRDTLVLRRGMSTASSAAPFTVAEDGTVSAPPGRRFDLVTRARLARLGTSSGEQAFTLSRRSIARAREFGLSSTHALAWLGGESAVPPILRVALERWSAPARGGSNQSSVSLGSLVVLRVEDPKIAHALRTSERVAPLLAGELAPGWLVVNASERKRLEALLSEIGLDVGSTPVVPALSPSAAALPNTDELMKEIDALLALTKRSRGRANTRRRAR